MAETGAGTGTSRRTGTAGTTATTGTAGAATAAAAATATGETAVAARRSSRRVCRALCAAAVFLVFGKFSLGNSTSLLFGTLSPRGASQLEQNAVCESAQAAFSVERSAEVRLLAQKEFLGGQILGGPTVPKTQITRMA